MSRSPVSTLWVGAIFFASFRLLAQSPMANPANPDSALQQILETLQGTRLSLHDAEQNALSNATSVRTAEAAFRSAGGTRRTQAGYFDPTLFFAVHHLDQQQPGVSLFSGNTKQNTLTGGLRINLPTGTSLEASLNTVKLELNSPVTFLNPQYDAIANLSLRQPLLEGFFISANKNLTKADRDLDAAKSRYDQEVLATNTQVEQAYWDLYAAERDYAVQKLTRDQAQAFLKDTETRAKTGLIGPNQVANAKTFLAEQEILLLDREEALDRLSDQLASLIGLRPADGKQRFIVSDSPSEEFPLQDVDALVQQALERNLEIRAARAEAEGVRALAKAAFWESLPKLDLVGSLGGSGVGGVPQNVIFGSDTLRSSVTGTWNDALRQAVNRKFPSWSLGLELTIPLGMRTGLGEEDRLEAEVTMAEQRTTQRERVLEEQVRAGHRELTNGQRRLEAAKTGVLAAQEQVRIGLIEFQNGRTTAFELVRLSADFAVAQQRYSLALVRSAKAAAALRQLTSGAYLSHEP
jgi:outer membrane protein TolC